MKKNVFSSLIIILFFAAFSSAFSLNCCDYVEVKTTVNSDCCVKFEIRNKYCSGGSTATLSIKNYTQWILIKSADINTSPDFVYFNTVCPVETGRLEYSLVFNDAACRRVFTEVIDLSSCCDCPTVPSDVVEFQIDDDSPDCPDGCKITPIIKVNPELTCFKYLTVGSYDFPDIYRLNLGDPIPSFCAPKGVSIQYIFYLSKVPLISEEDYDIKGNCRFEATTPTCVEKPPVPCVPDCENDPFITMPTLRLNLLNCPGCMVDVSYAAREACNNQFQDLQILSIDYRTPECETNCSIEDIYKEVLGAVISINKMGFEPTDPNECNTQWRIANGGCWGKEILYYDTEDGHFEEVIRWHSCYDADCCLQMLKVCRIDRYTVNVERIGTVIGDSCQGYIFDPDLGQTLQCIPACSWAGEMNGNYNGPINYKVTEDSDRGAYSFKLNLEREIDRILFNIDNNSGNSVSIEVYDINGKQISSLNTNLARGKNSIPVNISGLQSGTYLYNVVIDGVKINTGKFGITK